MIKKTIDRIIRPTALIFTGMMLFFALGMELAGMNKKAFLPADILVLLGISLAFAAISLVFYVKSFNYYVRTAIHLIATSLTLYFLLYIVSLTSDNVSNLAGMRVFATILYIVLYILAATAVICIRIAKGKK